jgi:serine/threonine-protein kinase
MSPEQARGEEVIDQRSDIWSFCVVLYQVITGRAPFEGLNYNALLRSILELSPPTLAELAASDQELSRVVELGMAKDRAKRWQTMQDLGSALAHWLIQQGLFEDAAGGSLEAKWVYRRTDPSYRGSRPSLGSIPGIAPGTPTPGLPGAASPLIFGSALTPRPERGAAGSEAPTSVGPVVTGAERSPRLRLLVPVALGAVALLAGLGVWIAGRPASPPSAQAPPHSVQVAPIPPAPSTEPETEEEQAEEIEPEFPAAPPPSALVSALEAPAAPPPQRKSVSRPRRSAPKKAPPPSGSGAKPRLDLMTPY